jgi:hypothetical protein
VNAALGVVLIVIAVAVALGILLFIRRNIADWEEKAERALPGPLT